MKDKLAIIVPYRDRQEHLDVFVPHMHEFLKDKGIDYTIFIAEQTDERPFNYGKLCNVATKEIPKEYTYFAFHDIDMLPVDDECDYSYPDEPTHLATNVEAHDNTLPYPQYFGGVVLINREDFENANGYSNEYWGYGFQDLDLLYRLKRSRAYLEKFFDLNQTYSRYDQHDILPYRIENVEITNNPRIQTIDTIKLEKENKIYGVINDFAKKNIENGFGISLWFKDSDESKDIKNIFSFEGCDTGIFLSDGKYVIGQIWSDDEVHTEISQDYFKNKWNHVVLSYNDKKFTMWLNNKKSEITLPEKFKLYDYARHCIKISDDESQIEVGSILLSANLNDDIVSELYFRGTKSLDLIQNKYGCSIYTWYDFKSLYSDKLLLDKGTNLNHIRMSNSTKPTTIDIELTDEIYLPIRLNGKYKSLVHENDTNIIKRYYEYNPDIDVNADIFFHEVLSNQLDYKTLGLSTLKYSILDIQNKKNYELIRIVT